MQVNAHINRKQLPSLPEAMTAAYMEAANTAGFVLTGVLFRQGSRQCVSTAFPVRQVIASLQVNQAKKGNSVAEVQAATNRPVMTDHVDAIAQYLVENVGAKYILPPMTLNVQQAISLYEPDFNSEMKPVYIVIPITARLAVTDGGHRTTAIIQALENLSAEDRAHFEGDAVSVMITLESDMSQVHQDFADCSKTKALPPSQLAAYDRRNPANGLVLDIIESCPLFKNRIDSTSKTLSKKSNHLFLTNQVRQLIKELLVGDYGMADSAFEDKAKDILGSSETEVYKTERARFIEYVQAVTEAIPVLRGIAKLPTAGVASTKVSDHREEGYVCLSATGLVIIGRIGHELFKSENANWKDVVARFSEIDWKRSGPLWDGNVVRDGKIVTQRAAVKAGVENVRIALGFKPDPKFSIAAELETLLGDFNLEDDIRQDAVPASVAVPAAI
ncbi:MAG TPA: DNA sulfur modification protein DndB [Rhizomicrobium sp.]|nr:DNA sulfur modification protein DndB [Rhizomicrobium sp.]